MRRLSEFFFALVTIIGVASCTPITVTPVPKVLPTSTLPHKLFIAPLLPTNANYPALEALRDASPIIDGSTSTQPLRTLIICRMFDVPCGWQGNLGERTMAPATLAKDGQMLRYVIDDRIKNSNTHDAYMALLESSVDLILVARPPSADELKAAQTKDTDFDVRPIARDAFVFLAHDSNPVTNLTLEQARAIYQGKITNWKEVGGSDQPIIAYQRDNNSGSQELMLSLVMKGAPMIKASACLIPCNLDADMVIPTMSGAVNAIHTNPKGIGYSVYYYTTYMFPDPEVKLLSINGVLPTPETIADTSYPLSTEVYAVTQSRSWRGSAIELRDWLLTDEGRAVIKESGYVLSLEQ